MTRGTIRTLLGLAAIAVGAGVAAPAQAQMARLTLTSVFGRAPSGLNIPFGTVDFDCVNPPAAGLTCTSSGSSATWYGGVAFRVQLAGAGGGVRVRLTGVRKAGGTVPAGALVDGPAGAVPTTGYPVQPGNPITLASAIGPGNSNVTRSIGLRVAGSDASGPWSTGLVYSLVVE